MANSEFWKDRQAEFEKYSHQYFDLKAHWKVKSRKWLLWWGSTPSGSHIPQECNDVFNAIARRAATELPGSCINSDAEPGQLWLDFMRKRGWGFRVTGHVECTEREWDAGVKDGKSLYQVRREQKYTTGDEWTKVYRRTKSGKLRRLSARELRGKSSNDLQKFYHWLENGTIDHVFESSARFCEELAARAFEVEAVTRATKGGLPKAGENGTTRQGYRSEIKAYMMANGLSTNRIAAQRLGVSVDTLKSIMSSKGKPRFSERTLDDVLKKIGYKKP